MVTTMRFLLFFVAAVLALPVHQRDLATTTEKIGWAQLLGLAVATSSATTAPTTAIVAPTTAITVATTAAPTVQTTATATKTSGWLANLLAIFDGTTSATPTPTPTATTTSSTSGGWLSKLLALFSSKSLTLSLTAALTGGALATSNSPSFTGLVVVAGAGSGGSTGTINTASQAVLTGAVAQAVEWAEEGAGITYSPYTKSGLCKSASQVASDIAELRAFPLIRLYAVDCLGILTVMAAMLSSQKLFLGVWGLDNVESDLESMALQVALGSRGWSAVHTVSIGNEVVNSGAGTAAQVRAAVQTARLWFKSNAPSYSGYIVAVDTLAAVMADSSMCDISDYLAVNCHPYFSGVEALTSGTWLKQQVAALKSLCGNGKSVLVTESGWPTQGNTVGDAVPSQLNQVAALEGLATVMGSQVIMFTTYNDYWKDPGPYNVEQHWGIYGDPLA